MNHRRNRNTPVRVHTGYNFPFAFLDALSADCGIGTTPPSCYNDIDVDSETIGLQSMTDCPEYAIADFAKMYAVCKSFSKYVPAVESDTQETARLERTFMKFAEAEQACVQTDDRLYEWTDDSSGWMGRVLRHAQQFAARVLRDDPHTPGMLSRWARFGPGSTIGNPRPYIDHGSKFRRYPYTCTDRARSIASELILTDERWVRYLWSVDSTALFDSVENSSAGTCDISPFVRSVTGSRIVCVPKNRKVHRTIAVEPTLNQYCQLAVDGYIRRRLRQCGMNINTQLLNQQLACLGSRDGSYATLDLSMASDTVSVSCARLILPSMWFRFLCDLRSPQYTLNGVARNFYKLQSMGNGSTFVVESLIFLAIAHGVREETHARGRLLAYGDDLIVPDAMTIPLSNALEWFGFSVNTEKSFHGNTGVRESCGTDWVHGCNIRPPFVKKPPETLGDLFHIYNSWYLWYQSWLPEITFEESRLGRFIKTFIPRGYTDLVGPMWDDTSTHRFSPARAMSHRVYREHRVSMDQPEFWSGLLANRLKPRPVEGYPDIDIASEGSVFSVPGATRARTENCYRYDLL